MLVIKDLNGDTPDGVNYFLNIDHYQENSEDKILMYGINTTLNFSLQDKYKTFKHKSLLNLWSPCEFTQTTDPAGQTAFEQISFFDKVYTICPYTAKWLNELFGDNKHQEIFYPFNESIIPEIQTKEYDVCYFGGLHGIDHYECIDEIKNFNYRFISQQHYSSPYAPTDYNVSFFNKLNIISKTKISVCYNLLYMRHDQQEIIKMYDSWNKNDAFVHMNKNGIVPQFKQRVHESAFCKTLILCKRDPWNIIEHYYTPGEDFIYFEDNKQLGSLIQDILNNYEDYSGIIENAYKKSLNYTSEKLYNHIKNDYVWKT